MPKNKGNGAAVRWLQGQITSWVSDECLYWPFGKCNGYGLFGLNGRQHYAHRYVCEQVHGPAPSPDHEAAHECGQGAHGCVSPRHVVWKTRTENQLDRALHGTKATGPRGKLTPEQAAQILALKGTKPQREIAAMFGVSRSNVSFIHCGKAWSKRPRGVTFRPDRQKWRARISEVRSGKRVWEVVGYFDTEQEAIDAYEHAIGRAAKAA